MWLTLLCIPHVESDCCCMLAGGCSYLARAPAADVSAGSHYAVRLVTPTVHPHCVAQRMAECDAAVLLCMTQRGVFDMQPCTLPRTVVAAN
jgi:hypothetical protein